MQEICRSISLHFQSLVEEHAPESNFLRVCRKKAAVPRLSIPATWENGETRGAKGSKGTESAAQPQKTGLESRKANKTARKSASSAARELFVARRGSTVTLGIEAPSRKCQ